MGFALGRFTAEPDAAEVVAEVEPLGRMPARFCIDRLPGGRGKEKSEEIWRDCVALRHACMRDTFCLERFQARGAEAWPDVVDYATFMDQQKKAGRGLPDE